MAKYIQYHNLLAYVWLQLLLYRLGPLTTEVLLSDPILQHFWRSASTLLSLISSFYIPDDYDVRHDQRWVWSNTRDPDIRIDGEGYFIVRSKSRSGFKYYKKVFLLVVALEILFLISVTREVELSYLIPLLLFIPSMFTCRLICLLYPILRTQSFEALKPLNSGSTRHSVTFFSGLV